MDLRFCWCCSLQSGVAREYHLPVCIWHWLQHQFRRDIADEDERWLQQDREPDAPSSEPPVSTDVVSSTSVPEDFRIEISAGAVMPTSRQQRLWLDRRGVVEYVHVDEVGDEEPLETRFYMAEAHVAYVVDSVNDLNFFDQASQDAGYVDGDYLEVLVTLHGREHRVSLFNAFNDQVTHLVRRVNAIVPETMRLMYSQLDQPEPADWRDVSG